jgi:hypothetical protein
MRRISSSAVELENYNEAAQTLDLWYRGGDRYTYFGVPREVYDALRAAPSYGVFVNKEVKPHYRYELEPRRRRFRPSDDSG